ncbi:MAG: MBL fold metallo-hydrolase [Ignavibacteriaceae bacterium]|jgi:ribonuclease Z
MSIKYQILGRPGKDNALYIRLNSGTKMYRILFDCGEKTLEDLKQHDVKGITYIFFSHLHIDHISGFDYFFRRNYDREKPIFIWGPDGTAEILHHRLLGYKWNLIGDEGGNWFITDINNNSQIQFYIKFPDAFSNRNLVGKKTLNKHLLETKNFVIKSIRLNHIIPSIGYLLIENPSHNIIPEKLEKLNLPKGNWLEKLKDFSFEDSVKIEIDGKGLSLGELRKELLETTEGESIAYLTDFILDNDSKEKLLQFLEGCHTLVCESQYLDKDIQLAATNYHLTAAQAATIAKESGVKKLILFHISERYQNNFKEVLFEAREIFKDTYFPENWEKI